MKLKSDDFKQFSTFLQFCKLNKFQFEPFSEESGSESVNYYKDGSKIKIKKENKGKFTDYCGGKVTSECIQRGKNSSDPKIRKRATFAANARKWKHESGGVLSNLRYSDFNSLFNLQEMNYSQLFSTYLVVEPPKGYKDKAKTEIRDIETTNFTKYPMMITIDSPAVETEPEVINLFDEYQVEEPISVQQDEDIEEGRDLANSVVSLARTFVGGKYVWGGSSPSVGFDCSGLILYVYGQNGISLPRTSTAMEKIGTPVQLADARPGDLVCTKGHVQMVSKVEDGQIYVVEAKGKRYGIVEGPLTNTSNIITIRRVIDYGNQPLELNNVTSPNGKFTNQTTFIKALDTAYRQALMRNNMDPNWAPMLVASASIESAWGASPSGSFNYGGVKVSDAQKRAGVPYTDRMTVDYVPGQGNIKRSQPFRDFQSVQDYCNYMVGWLKNSSRYGAAFTRFTPNQPVQAWDYICRAGYGGGSESNLRTYAGWMRSRVNIVNRTISS